MSDWLEVKVYIRMYDNVYLNHTHHTTTTTALYIQCTFWCMVWGRWLEFLFSWWHSRIWNYITKNVYACILYEVSIVYSVQSTVTTQQNYHQHLFESPNQKRAEKGIKSRAEKYKKEKRCVLCVCVASKWHIFLHGWWRWWWYLLFCGPFSLFFLPSQIFYCYGQTTQRRRMNEAILKQ